MDGTITDRTRDEIKAVVESETPGAWQNSKQFDPYGCGGDPSRLDSDCDDDRTPMMIRKQIQKKMMIAAMTSEGLFKRPLLSKKPTQCRFFNVAG